MPLYPPKRRRFDAVKKNNKLIEPSGSEGTGRIVDSTGPILVQPISSPNDRIGIMTNRRSDQLVRSNF